MVVGFIIWSIAAVIFMLIGISAWRAKEEAGFFTFSKPPKMNDVVKYNHAVGRLWFSFAAILEVMGIPILFIEQNSPIFILLIFAVMALVAAIMMIYLRIEKKYRQ